MSPEQTTPIRIELHQLARLRWPKEPIAGDGPRADVSVPLPRLPWSKAAVTVPLGQGAAASIDRVLTLRKIFGYGIAPVIVALFVIADVVLISARAGAGHPSGALFLTLAVIGVVLILCGLLPDVVARSTGTPYVTRGRLYLPAARLSVVRQLVKLNPQVTIDGAPLGDTASPR